MLQLPMTTNKLALGIVIGGSITSILTLAIVLAFFFAGVNTGPTGCCMAFDDTPIAETDEETTSELLDDTRTYKTTLRDEEISFEYPTGWHMEGIRNFETGEYSFPSLTLRLDQDPLVATSPSGGPRGATIELFGLTDEGPAIMAELESLPAWQTFTTDKITVNGKTVERVIITTDMSHPSVSYEIPFTERLFIKGEKQYFMAYHYYAEASEANEPAWELFKSTLSIK